MPVPDAGWSRPPRDDRSRTVSALLPCDVPLVEQYDVAMLDLDGVVYRGDDAVAHAADALADARGRGATLAYVTNNAANPPEVVVEKLRRLGMPADDGSVVTSAQAASRLVATLVPPGAPVLVVGGPGLVAALRERGLVPVTSLDDAPAAVVQGFSPTLAWADLAEGAYAVASGLPWVASNTDATIPTARGIAPGNGTMVSAVATAASREPQVAGKPYAPLFDETVLRVGGTRPLVVGDRLDTDIEGANVVGADSLLVLTGVSDLPAAAAAQPAARPTFVGPDLRALLHPQPAVVVDSETATCGRTGVRCDRGTVLVRDDQDDRTGGADVEGAVALLRATLALAWSHADGAHGACDVSAVMDALTSRAVR